MCTVTYFGLDLFKRICAFSSFSVELSDSEADDSSSSGLSSWSLLNVLSSSRSANGGESGVSYTDEAKKRTITTTTHHTQQFIVDYTSDGANNAELTREKIWLYRLFFFYLPHGYYDSNSCCFHYFVLALVHPLEHCLLMIVNPNVGDSFVWQFDWICFLFYYLYRFFVLHHPHCSHLDWLCLFHRSCLPYLRYILLDLVVKMKVLCSYPPNKKEERNDLFMCKIYFS